MATVAALQSEVDATVRLWCLRHAEAEHLTTGTACALPTGPLTDRLPTPLREAPFELLH